MRVLIAVEDKIYGDAIVDFVAKHNWESGTEFKVIHATHLEEMGYVTSSRYCCDVARSLIEERERRARALVKGVAAGIQTKLSGVSVSEQITLGSPKDVILDTAEEWKADMIVLGSHGRKGFSRFMLGSVSLSVLSHARCSVMIVKLPPAEEQKPADREAQKIA